MHTVGLASRVSPTVFWKELFRLAEKETPKELPKQRAGRVMCECGKEVAYRTTGKIPRLLPAHATPQGGPCPLSRPRKEPVHDPSKPAAIAEDSETNEPNHTGAATNRANVEISTESASTESSTDTGVQSVDTTRSQQSS